MSELATITLSRKFYADDVEGKDDRELQLFFQDTFADVIDNFKINHPTYKIVNFNTQLVPDGIVDGQRTYSANVILDYRIPEEPFVSMKERIDAAKSEVSDL